MFYFSRKIKQSVSQNIPCWQKHNSFLFYKSNKNYLSFCCFKMIHFVRNPYIFWQKNAGFTIQSESFKAYFYIRKYFIFAKNKNTAKSRADLYEKTFDFS